MKKVFKSLKFLYVLIVLYFLPIPVFAQSPVNVTATVKDSAGIPYSNATVSILLIPTGTAPTVGGAQINGTNNGQLDVNGKLNVSLYKNTDIVPASSQWQFTICETPGVAPPLGTGGQCFTSSQTVSAAVDFSTQFQAAAKALTTVTVGGSGSVTHTAGNLTAGNVVIGNGAADVKVDSACVTNGTGALSGCTSIATTGSISTGSGASAVGPTALGGGGCVEATNVGYTPTAGQTYLRCDNTLNNYAVSIPLNGATETPLPVFNAVPVGTKCLHTSGAAGLIAETASDCAAAPSFPVTVSGTVTSGGIPYFNSATQESSSGVLVSTNLVLGGGPGGAPITSAAYDSAAPSGSASINIPNNGGNNLNITNGADSNILITMSASGAGTKYARITQAQNEQLRFGQNNTQNWMIDVGGHFRASTDNIYDIGAAGATRPRTLYLGTSLNTPLLATTTNCSSSASPAVCGAAPAGSVAVPTGVTPTLVVNTTAVTANSQILFTPDESLGTKLGVTCNSTIAQVAIEPIVTARTAATSFTIQYNTTITVNPICLSYLIVN